MARETLYEVLQVRTTAEAEVIEGAYKRLVGKYHPDKNRSPDATKRLQELNEAFRILRDPALRAAYDEERQRHLKSERERRDREQQEERKRERDRWEREWAAHSQRDAAPPDPPEGAPVDEAEDSPVAPAPAKPSAPPGAREAPSARPTPAPGAAASDKKSNFWSWVIRPLFAIGTYMLISRACAPDHRAPTRPPPLADAPERPAQVIPAPLPPSGPRLRAAASVCVVNTAGQGVYLRSLPRLDARFGAAYSEGTALRVLEDQCAAGSKDAQEFCLVAAPDGSTGYVPSKYLSSVCVARAPARTTPVTSERESSVAEPRCVWQSDCPTGSRCEAELGQAGRCVVYPGAPARRSLLGTDNFPIRRSPIDE